jgi:hypothetical protein
MYLYMELVVLLEFLVQLLQLGVLLLQLAHLQQLLVQGLDLLLQLLRTACQLLPCCHGCLHGLPAHSNSHGTLVLGATPDSSGLLVHNHAPAVLCSSSSTVQLRPELSNLLLRFL